MLALEFEAQKVGYLVSESTPTAYADKSMSAYVNNFVRYRIFDHKEDIVKYFTSQLEPTLKKIEKWQKWLDTIDQVMPFLQEKYANIQDRESIASEIANIYFG